MSEDERDRFLASRWRQHGDHAARAALVESRLPYARALARHFKAVGEQLEDLEQVAALGLLHAIDRFEPAHDVSFKTFAYPTIRGFLLHHVRDNAWSVHTPRRVQERALKVGRAYSRLTATGGRPSDERIAAVAGLTVAEARDACVAMAGYRTLSLEGRLGWHMPDRALATEDPDLPRAEARATLAPLLRQIDVRSREILRLRFEKDLTQSAIAARLGMSQMHVSRLLRRALARMASAAAETAEASAA